MDIVNVTFVGLGVMGYPMAGFLKKNGYKVTVYNRTISKAEKWAKEYNGTASKYLRESFSNAELIFICVGRDQDLREVMEGENGILENSKDKCIIVDHTTASANIAREYSLLCRKNNKVFLDAPISGGQVGAETGQLSIMVGGDKDSFNLVKPVLKSYGKAIELSDANLLRCLLTNPLMTFKVIFGIHWEAFVLLIKGIKFYKYNT